MNKACKKCFSKITSGSRSGLCKTIHKGFDKDRFLKAAEELQAVNTIQKLSKRRGVKLSSTVAGQRELIREMRNKMDEVIDAVNELKGKV